MALSEVEDIVSRINQLSKKDRQNVFRNLYYHSKVLHGKTHWLGLPSQKVVTDAWIYQELIFKVGPQLIIETGTAKGGGAHFLASICELLNYGEVVTIDIQNRMKKVRRRLTRIIGSSTDPFVVNQINAEGKTVMVILDSEHTYEHVWKELEIYGPMVSKGSYLIVEDTYLPVVEKAVKEFLEVNSDFCVDEECEKFFATYNPGGYLKRN